MCGICGIYNNGDIIEAAVLERMTNSMRHRGPDDEGYVLICTNSGELRAFSGEDSVKEVKGLYPQIQTCSSSSFNLGFGHRRLSIIDLSERGHQPMSNKDKNIWITYNGEIYNYIELRSELEERGYDFITKSDTEIIIYAYQEWGVDCLQKFNGMWAFAIWDQRENRLFCSRDRLGIKPFYYSYEEGNFAFSSEIKGLLQLGMERKANDEMVYDYLALGLQDHTENTFFKGINQLRPAHFILISDDGFTINRYWDVKVNDKIKDDISDDSEFNRLFEDSIRLRLRSDVPIGSCLSGGLDSSSIFCVMSDLLSDKRNLMTFSACYEDKRFDERYYIETIIEKKRPNANYIFPSADAFHTELGELIYFQDEPFGSLSTYAQWAVMKKASEKVKVLLDGQGADELLGGYLEYYASFLKTLIHTGNYILCINELIRFTLLHSEQIFEQLSKMRMRERRKRLLSPKFSSGFGTNRYRYLEDISSRLLDHLTRDRLPALLRYEDRNSMAFSVESRLPFLDYRLVEHAASLPLNQKFRDGTTKFVLRRAMRGIIPEDIIKRRDKMGFVTPEEVWMKTELRVWAEEVISSNSFRSRIYWDGDEVLKEFRDICSGKRRYSSDLWRYICLELWLRSFIDDD